MRLTVVELFYGEVSVFKADIVKMTVSVLFKELEILKTGKMNKECDQSKNVTIRVSLKS